MLNDKLKNHLHLHFLVFIAGFTAILGQLIAIQAVPLVWFRMIIASVLIFIYIKVAKTKISVAPKALLKLSVAGIVIALHWITFFGAIDASNVSITLAVFSTGTFFASILEPIIHKRRIIWYEILFGIFIILGVFIITQSEINYIKGIVLGILSAFLSSLFAVLNGAFLKQHTPTVISFYEFISGVLFITLFILFFGDGFSFQFFDVSTIDFLYLFILGSICTAYAFVAAVYVMRHISPYSVVLTYSLEPIYGIIIAVILFPDKEKMSPSFYYGAAIIIITVVLNAVLKNIRKLKSKRS
jgi:drug/metabolite transporter (DMT)-like permease